MSLLVKLSLIVVSVSLSSLDCSSSSEILGRGSVIFIKSVAYVNRVFSLEEAVNTSDWLFVDDDAKAESGLSSSVSERCSLFFFFFPDLYFEIDPCLTKVFFDSRFFDGSDFFSNFFSGLG